MSGNGTVNGAHSTPRKLMGWFLILVIGGPVVLVVFYGLLHAFMPRADPSLILLPLVLSALFIIAVGFIITFVVQRRKRRRVITQRGTPNGIAECSTSRGDSRI